MIKHRTLPLYLLAALAILPAATARAQDGPPDGNAAGVSARAMGPGGGRGVGGTVTAVSGTTLTIKTEEGDSYQIFTGANSRLMKQREPIKISDIHVGDVLMAGGELDAKAKTIGAVFVAVLTPEQAAQAKKAREDFGKTWTAGEVTAIKDLTISIKRRDGVAQDVLVDENTSFKKRRDSITLADIQVGDRLAAQGAPKGSAFLATSVNIGGMGPGGGNGRGLGGGAPPPPQQ